MVKKCIKLFITGFVLSITGAIGIAVLTVNGLINADDLRLGSSAIEETTAETTMIIGNVLKYFVTLPIYNYRRKTKGDK